MTELLSLVAGLDQGAVILPGLDRDRDAAEWSEIEEDEAHPQHLMAGLLRALDLTRAEVRDWPPSGRHSIPALGFEALSDLPLFVSLSRSAGEGAERSEASEGVCARRVRLIAEALRPAVTTDAWRRLPAQPADTLDGLTRYDCASAQQEAVTIALLLRRKLETPGATAALVTPDRALARRVAAELRRWGIDIDDSAGLPLNRTPPGVFLRLVLDLAASAARPGALACRAEASARLRRARSGCLPRSRPSARTSDPRAASRSGLRWPQGRARRRESRSVEVCRPARGLPRPAAGTAGREMPYRCRVLRRRMSRLPSGLPRPQPKPAASGFGVRRRAKRRHASAMS